MLSGYARFDLGRSLFKDRPVMELVLERMPVSVSLGLWSTLIIYLVSIPLGIRKAVRDGSRFDVWTSGVVLVGYAIPGFLFAIMLVVLFAGGSFLQWFPLRGLLSPGMQDAPFAARALRHAVSTVREIVAGRHAQWPMVLAAQSFIADPSRIDARGRRPFWTYAHVPAGSTVDQRDAITAIMERFAPGFTDIVVSARSIPANRLADHDANYVGGDIGVGGNAVLRALLGPTPRVNPWATPIPRAYLCSSATPPGGGVHGMSGYYAARTVLKREFGLKVPALAP
jgi:hypothetical protein